MIELVKIIEPMNAAQAGFDIARLPTGVYWLIVVAICCMADSYAYHLVTINVYSQGY